MQVDFKDSVAEEIQRDLTILSKLRASFRRMEFSAGSNLTLLASHPKRMFRPMNCGSSKPTRHVRITQVYHERTLRSEYEFIMVACQSPWNHQVSSLASVGDIRNIPVPPQAPAIIMLQPHGNALHAIKSHFLPQNPTLSHLNTARSYGNIS